MIKGISKENPAELRDRLMLKIWSTYDVIGDVIRLFTQHRSVLADSGRSAIVREKRAPRTRMAPHIAGPSISDTYWKLKSVANRCQGTICMGIEM